MRRCRAPGHRRTAETSACSAPAAAVQHRAKLLHRRNAADHRALRHLAPKVAQSAARALGRQRTVDRTDRRPANDVEILALEQRGHDARLVRAARAAAAEDEGAPWGLVTCIRATVSAFPRASLPEAAAIEPRRPLAPNGCSRLAIPLRVSAVLQERVVDVVVDRSRMPMTAGPSTYTSGNRCASHR